MRNTQHVAVKRSAYTTRRAVFYKIISNVVRPHLLLDTTAFTSSQGQRFYSSYVRVELILYFFPLTKYTHTVAAFRCDGKCHREKKKRVTSRR